jgi:hypothetical protein
MVRPDSRLGARTPFWLAVSLGIGLWLSPLACTQSSDSDSAGLGGQAGGQSTQTGGQSGTPTGCPLADSFADRVLSVSFGEGQDFGRDHFPDWVLGGPRGGGAGAGATSHVVSLGDGGFVELAFHASGFKNGPGPDLIVFENAFYVGGDPETPFAELGRVAVSQDGETWHKFPCDPETFRGCAGVSPVLANVDENDIDPLDPARAGGDAFDLEDLGLDRASYVRVSDIAGDSDAISGVFDLDAVAVIYPVCDL